MLPEEPPDTADPPPPPAPPAVTGFPEEPAGPAAPPELQSGGTWVAVEVAEDTLEFDLPEDSWDNFFEDGLPEAPRPAVAAAEPVADPEGADLPVVEPGAEHQAEPVAETLPETPVDTPVDTPAETWSETESRLAPPDELAEDLGPGPAGDPEAGTAPADEFAEFDDLDADPALDVGRGIGSATVDQAGIYRALSAERDLALDDDADWQAQLAEVAGDEDDGAPAPVYVISDDPAAAAEPPVAAPPLPAASALDPPAAPDGPVVAWEEPDDPAATRAPAPLPADFVPDLPAGPGLAAAAAATPAPARDGAGFGDRPFVWQPPPAPPADTAPHRGYLAGSLLAALLLLTQLLHHNRDTLATYPALTEPLRRLYAALDLPLWPAWDLRAYELRSSEAVADRSHPGALDVLARIAVVGNEAVGLPLVRVTLRDRFNAAIGSRVFQPAEYLARATPLREPVAPGTQIPVEVSLKDPGRDAQGFDVDICLMTRRDGITCRSEREPFAR